MAWLYLAKVSRMVFIEIRAMVVLQVVSYFAAREKRATNLSACHSTPAGMLSMFANTAMPSRYMATMLPSLAKSSRHLYGCLWWSMLSAVEGKKKDKRKFLGCVCAPRLIYFIGTRRVYQ